MLLWTVFNSVSSVTGKCVNSDYDEVFIFLFVNNETVTVFPLSFQTPYKIKMGAPSTASFTVFQFKRDFLLNFHGKQ